MVLGLYVGAVVRSARGSHVLLGNDKSGEAEGKVVETASQGRFTYRKHAPAEAFVVALTPFQGSVNEDVEQDGFLERHL